MYLINEFLNGYAGYASYLWQEISHPSMHNYFYWLIGISLFFFLIEYYRPWRTDQPKFRKDFWLDCFYMFFNFFIFSLIFYNAASNVVVKIVNDLVLQIFNFDLSTSNPMRSWPIWAVLLTGFVVRDFIQWWIHRLLHRVPWLWNFHKVHHSVEEMGFAAHLRYHWMENVVYKGLEYLPLAFLGIGLHDFFIIHIFTLAVGHYNHSNINVSGSIVAGFIATLVGVSIAVSAFDIKIAEQLSFMGKLSIVAISASIGYFALGRFIKYLFNGPEMHIWHHAKQWPKGHQYGINFGLTLSVWDYVFGTAAIPHDGRDIKLGFEGVEHFPKDFLGQEKYGITVK
jgi:sterol desaturase/sphingolipid hydroxylase (fatty acid hydroxylase superfamily)